MEEQFKHNLLQYLQNGGKTEKAKIALSAQIDSVSADQSALKQLFHVLECVTDQFKIEAEDGREVSGLNHTDYGWHPLIKLLHALLSSGESADVGTPLKKRALNVLRELVGMTGLSAIGPNMKQLVNLALTPFDGDETEDSAKMCEKHDDIKAMFDRLKLHEKSGKCPHDVQLFALRALRAIFDKGQPSDTYGFEPLFPRLQRVLLAILADKKGGDELHNLSNECMSTVIAIHNDPNAVFSLLSDMSDDPDLMLKDDPLLDDLIEKCWARDNKLKGR